MLVAVHSDDIPGVKGNLPQPSAPRWIAALKAAGHEVRLVDVFCPEILEQLRGCSGLMWRFNHNTTCAQHGRRLMRVVEEQLGLVVYPDQATAWHYDDKIAQLYLFEALEIPHPRTWIWFDADSAVGWLRNAPLPLVVKLATGAGSSNVALVRSVADGTRFVRALFRGGVCNFNTLLGSPLQRMIETAREEVRRLLHGSTTGLMAGWELHRDYVYFQEFLEGNAFDTRITVIGNRAFAYRRFNREKDFRASGSGRLDWNQDAIDPAFIRLAFSAAAKLGTQSCAIDGMYRRGQPVLGEVSYTYVSSFIQKCPGYYRLEGTPESGLLSFVEQPMWPEEAQVADFIERLEQRGRSVGTPLPPVTA